MIGLVSLVKDDYLLAGTYVGIIILALLIKRTKNDLTIFIFGFVIMTIFELTFITTGVESFTRNSLFGLLPVWLPFLWGYGFIAINRSVNILNNR